MGNSKRFKLLKLSVSICQHTQVRIRNNSYYFNKKATGATAGDFRSQAAIGNGSRRFEMAGIRLAAAMAAAGDYGEVGNNDYGSEDLIMAVAIGCRFASKSSLACSLSPSKNLWATAEVVEVKADGDGATGGSVLEVLSKEVVLATAAGAEVTLALSPPFPLRFRESPEPIRP